MTITVPGIYDGLPADVMTLSVGHDCTAVVDAADFEIVGTHRWQVLRGHRGKLYAYRVTRKAGTIYITVAGHSRNLGRYQVEEEAARAYDIAALAAWGDFARLNFRAEGP